jgi:hypothetical protein
MFLKAPELLFTLYNKELIAPKRLGFLLITSKRFKKTFSLALSMFFIFDKLVLILNLTLCSLVWFFPGLVFCVFAASLFVKAILLLSFIALRSINSPSSICFLISALR